MKLHEEMKKSFENSMEIMPNEEETEQTIRQVYEETGYVLDTHTAVGKAVYEKYKKRHRTIQRRLLLQQQVPSNLREVS